MSLLEKEAFDWENRLLECGNGQSRAWWNGCSMQGSSVVMQSAKLKL